MNKEEVESIAKAYIRSNIGRNCIINKDILDKTYKDYLKNYEAVATSQSEEEFVCESYDYHLFEFCEHEDYEIVEDEDRDGKPYTYAVCPFCNRTASIEENMTEDGPEQVFNWE